MKINCPSCQVNITNKGIINRRRVGFVTEKQCPACSVWLRLNSKMEILKNSGLIVLLTTSILNVALIFPELNETFSLLGGLGACLALFAVLKGRLEVA